MNFNLLDSELFSDQYSVYRRRIEKRQNERGGGILRVFKQYIISRCRADLEPEIMVCDLPASNDKKTTRLIMNFLYRHE